MRLTAKLKDQTYIPNEDGRSYDMAQKLGKCEDIEEYLGISLEVAFNALRCGMYDETKVHRTVRSIDDYGVYAIDDDCPCQECDDFFKYEDYGKTWALTRKELK